MVRAPYTTFSKIVCLFQKFFDNGYIIWKYRLPKDENFCVISVNVQVTSISEKYVLDFTFPSQFCRIWSNFVYAMICSAKVLRYNWLDI